MASTSRIAKAYDLAGSAIKKGRSKFDKQVVLARIPMGMEMIESSMSLNIPCTGDVVADNLVIAAIGAAAITNIKRPTTAMAAIMKTMADIELEFQLSTMSGGIRFVVDEDLDDPQTTSAIQAHNNSVWYCGTDGFTRDHVKPFICAMVTLASCIVNGVGNFSLIEPSRRIRTAEWLLDSVEEVGERSIDVKESVWRTPFANTIVSFQEYIDLVRDTTIPREIVLKVFGNLDGKNVEVPSTILLSLVGKTRIETDRPYGVSELSSLVLGYTSQTEDEEKVGA